MADGAAAITGYAHSHPTQTNSPVILSTSNIEAGSAFVNVQ